MNGNRNNNARGFVRNSLPFTRGRWSTQMPAGKRSPRRRRSDPYPRSSLHSPHFILRPWTADLRRIRNQRCSRPPRTTISRVCGRRSHYGGDSGGPLLLSRTFNGSPTPGTNLTERPLETCMPDGAVLQLPGTATMTIDGVPMTVDCMGTLFTVPIPQRDTRVVTFYACKQSPCSSGNAVPRGHDYVPGSITRRDLRMLRRP